MFEKYSNMKFHENSSGGSRVVPWDRRTDRKDEAHSFRNFANAPKKAHIKYNITVIQFLLPHTVRKGYFGAIPVRAQIHKEMYFSWKSLGH